MEDGSIRLMQFGGTVHDLLAFPAQYFRDGYGYVNLDTMEWLTGSRQYNQLRIVAAVDQNDKDALEQLAVDISDRIEGYGYRVLSTDVPEPGEHWNADMVEAIMILLGTLGFFSIFLSVFLVINTISGVLKPASGTITFLDSAWAFFRAGLTTLDEVRRLAEETK